MTIREIVNQLLTISQRLYPDLTSDERTAIQNAATILLSITEALDGVIK